MKKSIALFCASSNTIEPLYFDQARKLGEWMGSEGLSLVYGGAAHGLMEAIAQAVKCSGGEVIGVMPESMVEQGRASTLPHRMVVVETLAHRKEVMIEMADAFVVLAGGVGTIDEMFDVLATAQLGFHHKPLVMCNTEGIYTPLIQFLDQLHEMNFSPQHRNVHYFVADSIDQVIEQLTDQFRNDKM